MIVGSANERLQNLMHLYFTKMQSLGNDFVVLDGVSRPVEISPSIARKIADRHFGIGCDQILLVEPGAETDFRFRIFNQDGSEVEQCGNGARCFAQFVRHKGLTEKDEITVQTSNARMVLTVRPDQSICVEMGVPEFEPERIPFDAPRMADVYSLSLGDADIEISAVAIGNPHSVLLVADVDSAPVARWGQIIESHDRFPQRVNAGFMQIISPGHIRLRVYERGVGETLGCGSGACAAVVVGIARGLLHSSVRVSLPGGDAMVDWQGKDQPVYLSGPAHTIFSGEIDLENLH